MGWICDEYSDHPSAALYASTDCGGTYMGQSLVFSNVFCLILGGVIAFIVIKESEEQLANAYIEISVTPFPIFNSVMPVQSLNALLLMIKTLSGIVTPVRDVQPLKQ